MTQTWSQWVTTYTPWYRPHINTATVRGFVTGRRRDNELRPFVNPYGRLASPRYIKTIIRGTVRSTDMHGRRGDVIIVICLDGVDSDGYLCAAYHVGYW